MVQRPTVQDSTAARAAPTTVPAARMPALAAEVLAEHLPLGMHGYRYHDADIYYVVAAAAAQQRSIESICRQLVTAPSGNLVRQVLAERVLTGTELEALEVRCNAALVARLPAGLVGTRQWVAIDLTLIPYYGQAAYDAGELRRGEAKAGTTRFHCYATAYVIRRGRRVSLALTFVYAEDALLDVLVDLVDRVQALGVSIQRLLLDRGFASVGILQWLHAQPFVSVVALPKRGARLNALLTGPRSYRTTYTMRSAEEGSVTFPLWVASRYAAGRRGRHGRDYLPFAVLGQVPCSASVLHLADEYRQRFGIEASYRLLHQVRATTTSRDPGLRLLLVTLACLLVNLWVYCQAYLVASTPRALRPAARHWVVTHFRLDTFTDLLIEGIKARFRTHTRLTYPFPLPAPLKL
jgi:hypothetical protein